MDGKISSLRAPNGFLMGKQLSGGILMSASRSATNGSRSSVRLGGWEETHAMYKPFKSICKRGRTYTHTHVRREIERTRDILFEIESVSKYMFTRPHPLAKLNK